MFTIRGIIKHDRLIERKIRVADASTPLGETLVPWLAAYNTVVRHKESPVAAIKQVREWTGLGLKEAKDVVDFITLVIDARDSM